MSQGGGGQLAPQIFRLCNMPALRRLILKWLIPLADSVELAIFFSEISHFLVHYVHKIRGIGNWILESATGPLLSARGIGHFKIATSSRLSGSFIKELTPMCPAHSP